MAYERLEAAAARDSLTNCLNHGAFVEAATAALANETNPGGTLLVIDADHFKSINDRFGHASGDTALKLIVAAIAASVEPRDIVGRLGGEEFGVLLHGSDIEPARNTAEAIRQAVRKIEFVADEQNCTLSVSIGGAIAERAVDFGDLFRLADERLYNVKQTGRNGIDIVPMPIEPSMGDGRLYREPRIKRLA
jgi:diguanylate cyclase (GGDEF)-like protein